MLMKRQNIEFPTIVESSNVWKETSNFIWEGSDEIQQKVKTGITDGDVLELQFIL